MFLSVALNKQKTHLTNNLFIKEDNSLSSTAVVNGDGVLFGNISMSDIKVSN